jgi:NAD(P) transhydrogenase subunit beta
MPIMNVDKAKTVVFVKRSMSPGFAGVENELFYLPNTMMVFGDAKKVLADLVASLKRR